jgi:uncharacterized protein (DUF697 family)
MKSNFVLILIYTVIAGLIAAIGSLVPGTSLLLTGLEVFMVVHLAKRHKFDLSLQALGFTATAIWGISTLLKDTAIELLKLIPGPGWVAGVIVAVVFVFFLGILANMYFKK